MNSTRNKLVFLSLLALALASTVQAAQSSNTTHPSGVSSTRAQPPEDVATEGCNETVFSQIAIDPGHSWRPPFGLERVGKPLTAVVEISSKRRIRREYTLVGYLDGKEVERRNVHVQRAHSIKVPVALDTYPNELVLFAKCKFEGKPVELARKTVPFASLEADAIARTEESVNPVDLGTVLVPAGWLLLAGGQRASVDVAVISYKENISDARVTAWYASEPQQKATRNLELQKRRRAEVSLPLPATPRQLDRDVLHVSITDAGGKEFWSKKIQTMLVWKPPKWPTFGATETKLRYDAPISVRDLKTASLFSIHYEDAWAPHLKDIVVSLPNGSRFVFWRGSSYVPFWAGRHNTGFCYEWAEKRPPPGGFVDSVEPLMDKELRYGRVEIVESTPARVHVRWRYQANDFNYKVWGDSVAEDFYFYPDGFGTRVVSLRSDPETPYQLSEFIILTSQGTYPLSVVPSTPIRALFIDGQKRELSYPVVGEYESNFVRNAWELGKQREVPAVYRIGLHKDEAATAIYFSPISDHPVTAFAPFFDRGYLVTPAYWGSHWPLARGMTSGSAIEGRIHLNPAHNSLMTFRIPHAITRTPISTASFTTLDTLGRSKSMDVRRWVWLIGLTDTSDAKLLEWAHSFSRPPSLEIKGAQLDFDAYVPERRAIRLVVEAQRVEVLIKPLLKWVNPVFELLRVPGQLLRVVVDGRPLQREEYAWDGQTLWLKADIEERAHLTFDFDNNSH